MAVPLGNLPGVLFFVSFAFFCGHPPRPCALVVNSNIREINHLQRLKRVYPGLNPPFHPPIFIYDPHCDPPFLLKRALMRVIFHAHPGWAPTSHVGVPAVPADWTPEPSHDKPYFGIAWLIVVYRVSADTFFGKNTQMYRLIPPSVTPLPTCPDIQCRGLRLSPCFRAFFASFCGHFPFSFCVTAPSVPSAPSSRMRDVFALKGHGVHLRLARIFALQNVKEPAPPDIGCRGSATLRGAPPLPAFAGHNPCQPLLPGRHPNARYFRTILSGVKLFAKKLVARWNPHPGLNFACRRLILPPQKSSDERAQNTSRHR